MLFDESSGPKVCLALNCGEMARRVMSAYRWGVARGIMPRACNSIVERRSGRPRSAIAPVGVAPCGAAANQRNRVATGAEREIESVTYLEPPRRFAQTLSAAATGEHACGMVPGNGTMSFVPESTTADVPHAEVDVGAA